MEYSLVRQKGIEFGNRLDSDEDTKYITRVASVPVEIFRKTVDAYPYPSVFEQSVTTLFQGEAISLRKTDFKKRRLDDQLNWTLDLAISHNIVIGGAGLIRITSGSDSEECCFSRLAAVCGGQNKFSVDMELEIGDEPGVKVTKIVRKNWRLRHLKSCNKFGLMLNYTGLTSLNRCWQTTDNAHVRPIGGKLRMDIRLSDKVFENMFMKNLQNPLSINKQLLLNSTLSDAVICVQNGDGFEEVKCHKGFLSAHSPVFKAMFESSAKEGITSKVKIDDMTAQGVRALLAYLYCWELDDASNCCSTALELLQAGNKYMIPKLVNSVQTLILAKEEDWFTAGVAAHLLHLAKSKCEEGDQTFQEIEKKALKILKSKTILELKECSELKQLLQDPKAALELCIFFIHQ